MTLIILCQDYRKEKGGEMALEIVTGGKNYKTEKNC